MRAAAEGAMGKKINLDTSARRIDVDNRLPLRNYYRIADNLLKQASIYREENNILDLYVMLLRYSSLLVDTIPSHRDYQVSLSKERAYYRKKLLAVMNQLETLEPEFRRLNELNKDQAGPKEYQIDAQKRTLNGSVTSSLEWSSINARPSSSLINTKAANNAPLSLSKSNYYNNPIVSTNSLGMQIQKLSINVPVPKKETLSRHSLLGQNGLQPQWRGPSQEIKVYYPSNKDLRSDSGLIQNVEYNPIAVKKFDSQAENSTMEALLSLDDGSWSRPLNESCPPLIRQPSPPPVRAKVQPEVMPISPSKVADPRPGPANAFHDGTPGSNSYQDLHIPVKMLDDFLRLARENTAKNLETCAVLAGSLKNRVFQITTLIVPKQESTSDSCSTLNEEEIFEVQDRLSLFPLGWIHTHPSQTCFMSSVDLHTHYSYQIMLPEAIAIVMAPTDTSSPHGIFHLSDPSGVSVIRNCQQRGFHPHEEPDDGSPIYEHCSHVFMNTNLRFDVLDLR